MESNNWEQELRGFTGEYLWPEARQIIKAELEKARGEGYNDGIEVGIEGQNIIIEDMKKACEKAREEGRQEAQCPNCTWERTGFCDKHREGVEQWSEVIRYEDKLK